MSDESNACDNCHCWHNAGTVKKTHGRYAPLHVYEELVMQCCFCGRYEPGNSQKALVLIRLPS